MPDNKDQSRIQRLSKTQERLACLGLALASGGGMLALAEATFVLAGVRPTSASHLSDRRLTTALDCYPSNPRRYFDVDLRDTPTLEKFRARRVRHLEERAAEAPYAVELRYNRTQFRDRDFGPRTPGRRRVVVLGDSFTEGQGVRADDILPRVLERLLNADDPKAGRWEVLNAGRRGADFPALYENFEQMLAYDPDLVVYALMLNDPETSESFRARHAYVYERIARGWQAPSPALLRVGALIQARLDARRVEHATTRWYRELYDEPNHEGWERTRATIARMDGQMRARGGRLLVVVWPVLAGLEGQYPFTAAHATIGTFCSRAGIACSDLLEVLRGRESASLWVHAVDRHPNEAAHRLAAEHLAPVVRRLNLSS